MCVCSCISVFEQDQICRRHKLIRGYESNTDSESVLAASQAHVLSSESLCFEVFQKSMSLMNSSATRHTRLGSLKSMACSKPGAYMNIHSYSNRQ
jgi:hypothetical protein